MHICFVSYWGLREGLTQATVLPHLQILADRKDVHLISFVTVERKGKVEPLAMEKVQHHVLSTSEAVAKKLFDKGKARKHLGEIHGNNPVDLVIARSSLAGWLVLDFTRVQGIPLAVESFEPHADYMLESGVWKKLDPRFVMAKAAEKRLKQQADWLLPVTRRYADQLVEEEDVDPAKVLVMPCCVDPDRFAFSAADRLRIRKDLGIPAKNTVGIYTGKLGGIYLEKEAMELFHSAHDYWHKKFHMIILSPDEEKWRQLLESSGFKQTDVSVQYVPMKDVPAYLSAADLAFSLHRPSPSKIGISPIKNAEYFANGLPVMIPEGIGDDTHMVEKWNLGVSFTMDEIGRQAMFNRVAPMVDQRTTSKRISDWAAKSRSFAIVKEHYQTILSGL
ncbi:MAG: glycosyltransferase [Cryomorphaceae bacterium]